MNEITLRETKLEHLSPEQFAAIEKAVLIDDLKRQYTTNRDILKFNVTEQVTKWLDTVESVHTKRMYNTALHQFMIYHAHTVLSLTPEQADDWIKFLKKDKCSGNTVKFYTRAVSSFYTHLERYHYVHKNPFLNSKVKVDTTPKDKYVPTETEVYKLIEELSKDSSNKNQYNAMVGVLLMRDYGVRKGFLDNMRLEDDYFVSFTKGKVQKIKVKEKDVKLYRAHEETLTKLNSNSISAIFNKAVNTLYERGEIGGKFSPHCLRHYFAVNYYRESGNDIYSTMEALGHSSITVTQKYLRSLNVEV